MVKVSEVGINKTSRISSTHGRLVMLSNIFSPQAKEDNNNTVHYHHHQKAHRESTQRAVMVTFSLNSAGSTATAESA